MDNSEYIFKVFDKMEYGSAFDCLLDVVRLDAIVRNDRNYEEIKTIAQGFLSRLRDENAAKDAEIEKLKEKLQELKKTLLRWAKTLEEMEKETGKIEYHYCAANYRIEVLAINTVLGKDGK